MSPKTKSLILTGLPLLLTLLVGFYFQVSFFANQEEITRWIQSFGPGLIAVYVILQWLTIIVAPLGGLFLQVAILGILGPELGFTVIYFVTTPAYLVNFFLAKRFGRNIADKLVGKGALTKFDHLAKDAGILTIVLLKVLLGGTFDYLAYVIGLTKVSYRQFITINFLFGIPGTLVSYFLFTRFTNFTQSIVANIVLAYVLGAIGIGISHWREKRRR